MTCDMIYVFMPNESLSRTAFLPLRRQNQSGKKKIAGRELKTRLDLVNIDIFIITAAVPILVELDVVVYAFVTVTR